MFDQEREDYERFFDFYAAKFNEEVGIMPGIFESDDFEIDFVVGQESGELRGIHILQFVEADDDDDIDDNDVNDVEDEETDGKSENENEKRVVKNRDIDKDNNKDNVKDNIDINVKIQKHSDNNDSNDEDIDLDDEDIDLNDEDIEFDDEDFIVAISYDLVSTPGGEIKGKPFLVLKLQDEEDNENSNSDGKVNEEDQEIEGHEVDELEDPIKTNSKEKLDLQPGEMLVAVYSTTGEPDGEISGAVIILGDNPDEKMIFLEAEELQDNE